jgi:hypothetical protein
MTPETKPITLPPEKTFSQFCRVVEALRDQGMPDLFDALQGAPVFEFDASTATYIKKFAASAPKAELARPPVMPFPEVVLIDPEGIVLFANARDFEIGENMVDSVFYDEGTGCERNAKVSLLRSVGATIFTTIAPNQNFPIGGWSMTFGRCSISGMEDDHRLFAIDSLSCLFGYMESATPIRVYDTSEKERITKLSERDFGNGVGAALDQLHYIDLPRHHLIMQEPTNRRERSKEKKVPRLRERPTVRLIEPEKVAKIYPRREGGEAGGTERCPHARRGYTRYLTSEHWKNRRWERIRVRPTWIGEREWTVGAYRFKVVARKNDAPEDGKTP